MKRSATMLLLMLASVAATAAGPRSDVFRWIDRAGVVHYSDKPPSAGLYTQLRLISSLALPVDESKDAAAKGKAAPGGAVYQATAPGTDAKAPDQVATVEQSVSAERICLEAKQQLEYLEARAVDRPVPDPNRHASRELEEEYQLRLGSYERYQASRDANLQRIGRLCLE